MTATDSTRTRDEAQLRELIADQSEAICAKDVDRIMSLYAAAVVAFDVKPPFRVGGADAWRKIWAECLPYFPDSFGIETRDLRLTVGADVALAHWLGRFTGMEPGHPAMQTWLRFTAGYQKVGGRWRVVHEHVSVPFDPHTGQAVFTLEP